MITKPLSPRSEFNWRAVEHSDGEPHAEDGPTPEVAVSSVMELLNKMIFCPANGGHRRVPTARGIASRWCVIRQLLGLDADRSLRQCAKDIGVTPAALSKLGIRFAEALKLSPPWMRSADVRAVYSQRQRGVAAGSHRATVAHERRRIREARRQENPPDAL